MNFLHASQLNTPNFLLICDGDVTCTLHTAQTRLLLLDVPKTAFDDALNSDDVLLLESNIGLELLNENGPAGISMESDIEDVVNLRRGCLKITCR